MTCETMHGRNASFIDYVSFMMRNKLITKEQSSLININIFFTNAIIQGKSKGSKMS